MPRSNAHRTYRFGNDYELTALIGGVRAGRATIPINWISHCSLSTTVKPAMLKGVAHCISATGALSWIAGAFYYDSSFERGGWEGNTPLRSGRRGWFSGAWSAVRSAGRFQDLLSVIPIPGSLRPGDLNMTERFAVTAGARWQTEQDTTVASQSFEANPHFARRFDTVDADLSRETDETRGR
jgi:hypothetical protein